MTAAPDERLIARVGGGSGVIGLGGARRHGQLGQVDRRLAAGTPDTRNYDLRMTAVAVLKSVYYDCCCCSRCPATQ